MCNCNQGRYQCACGRSQEVTTVTITQARISLAILLWLLMGAIGFYVEHIR